VTTTPKPAPTSAPTEQHGPFPDANTFPYPRLCVPFMREGTNYPRWSAGWVEYEYYEKERVTVNGKEHLVWKKIT